MYNLFRCFCNFKEPSKNNKKTEKKKQNKTSILVRKISSSNFSNILSLRTTPKATFFP